MNRLECRPFFVRRHFNHLVVLAVLAFGGVPAKADPITHYFTGAVTGVYNISPESDFGAFFTAVTLSGSVTFGGGDADSDGSPNRGYFDNVTLELNLNVPGLGEWLSVNNGLVEVMNDQSGVFDEADSISFVGGETGVRMGPEFGSSVFTSIQLTLLDNSPIGTPDMLSSDGLPGLLTGWERGFVYLNYVDYTVGYVPTTVRLEFVHVPEPSAFALLALGAGALGWWRRNRRA